MRDKIKFLNSKCVFKDLAMLTMEECGELTQALSKYCRRDYNKEEAYYYIEEEVADVCVCIERVKEAIGISDAEIQKIMQSKIDFAFAKEKHYEKYITNKKNDLD